MLRGNVKQVYQRVYIFALCNGTVGEVFQHNPVMTTARNKKIMRGFPRPLIAKKKLVLRYCEMDVGRPRLECVRGGGYFAPDWMTLFEGNEGTIGVCASFGRDEEMRSWKAVAMIVGCDDGRGLISGVSGVEHDN